MDMYTVMGNYTSSWLVKFMHSWPHIAFNLELVEKYNYSYDNMQYLESLAVIALFAMIWLLLSMIVFAIYFCCFKDARPHSSTNGCYCSLCLLLIFIMLALVIAASNKGSFKLLLLPDWAWVSVGVYGNLQAGEGLKTAVEAVDRGHNIFNEINNNMMELQMDCLSLTDYSNAMQIKSPDDIDGMYLTEFIKKYGSVCSEIVAQTQGVNDRLMWALNALPLVESYRNLTTIILLGFQLVICLMALVGICCRSKIFLTLMIVFGILCITATYFHIGADLIIDMSTADFCINPYAFVQNETVKKNYMTLSAATYFLECAYNSTNPFSPLIQEGRVLVTESQQYIIDNISNDTILENINLISNALQSSETTLNNLSRSIDCRQTKTELVKFIPSVCDRTLEGFAILTASVFAVAICLSFAMCAAAKVGKRYGAKGKKQNLSDEEYMSEAFLPTNNANNRPTMTTHTNNPLYGTSSSNFGVASHSLSIFRGSDDDVSTPLEQPPPYSPPQSDSHYNSMS